MKKKIQDSINKMQSKISGKPSLKQMVEEHLSEFTQNGGSERKILNDLKKKYSLTDAETENLAAAIDQEVERQQKA